jgi:5-methylcytosine-specific restriction endonuclease McrA
MPTRLKLNIGDKFFRLTIIEWSKDHVSWKCQCDCGNISYAHSSGLVKGLRRSCGCLNKEISKARRKVDNLAIKRRIYGNYRRGALRRKHDFSLTEDQFFHIIGLPCFYCGEKPSMKYKMDYKHDFKNNGIDRIDNNIGYIMENSVPCCFTCNRSKHKLSFDGWKE